MNNEGWAMYKSILLSLIAILFCQSSLAATTIFATDQAGSCETPTYIAFRCGGPWVGGAIADSLYGESVQERSAIEFSLAGIVKIETAELHLLATGFSGYPEVFTNVPVLEIHGYVGNGEVEYKDLLTDNLIYVTGEINALGLYKFDVTDFVDSLIANGELFAGFAFKDIVSNSAVSFYTDDGKSNTLVVTPEFTLVPIPGSVLLFGSSLVGLISFLKKHNKTI